MICFLTYGKDTKELWQYYQSYNEKSYKKSSRVLMDILLKVARRIPCPIGLYKKQFLVLTFC